MSASKPYILALDQGTTSSRAIVFNQRGSALAVAQIPFKQIYPQPGWVEHDAEAIWHSQWQAVSQVLRQLGINACQLAAIGVTNQRETCVVWDKQTGVPIYNAIVWQCRRTAAHCAELRQQGHEAMLQARTGLLCDAYFSASKLAWILNHVEGAAARAARGELLCGTIDSWLIWKLTQGRVHVTDVTNASRTQLFDIERKCWDEQLLELFGLPAAMLPKVVPSVGVVGEALIDNVAVPIAGIAGDQQSALFGQQCFAIGQAKTTYGTGCFLLMQTGQQRPHSQHQLLTTITVDAQGQPAYGLEGSVFMGGAIVQWLRDELGLISSAAESEQLACSVDDSGGVVLVPAFVGLGAPYWDGDARAMLLGLSRGSGRAQIVRAGLEAIALQCADVIHAMTQDAGMPLARLAVDGGACANDFLMQYQADITGVEVERPAQVESTALGVAFMAGLAVGFWPDTAALPPLRGQLQRFSPRLSAERRQQVQSHWQQAVRCCRSWRATTDADGYA